MGKGTTHPPALAAQAATSRGRTTSSPPSPAVAESPAADKRPLAPPYGAARPDYDKWEYGYPPFSGRMFGSGR